MRWTERQRAMLGAMGIELFERAPARPAATPPLVAEAEAGAAHADEADWLVVGEPIDDEADPTGAQAQLLDNMLRAIGASRTARERSGRAAFFAFAETPGGAGEAGPRARLRSALAEVRPRCAIALGRAAAQALLGSDEPLGALRGRTHRSGDVAVVASCSLAFLLRHPEEKARAWADLCLAVRAADAASAVAAG